MVSFSYFVPSEDHFAAAASAVIKYRHLLASFRTLHLFLGCHFWSLFQMEFYGSRSWIRVASVFSRFFSALPHY